MRHHRVAVVLALAAAAAVAISLPAAGPVRAGGDPSVAAVMELRKAKDALLPKLAAHAKWCRANKCIRESRDAWLRVVSLDGENAEARKALGHEKKNGRWYIPAVPKMTDTPPEFVEQAETRRKAIIDEYVAKALAVAAAAETPVAVREEATDGAVAADPTNDAARKAHHEALVNGQWVLEETPAAHARHAELVAVFKTKFDATPIPAPAAAAASDTDKEALGPDAVAVDSHFGRVAGTPRNDEVGDVARLQPGLEALFRKAVAEPRSLRRMKVLLFPDHAAGMAGVNRDARFDAGQKAMADALLGMWAPGTLDYYCYGETPAGRREASMRAAAGTWLFWKYQVDAKKGWALEGMNHWLSDIVLGTHKVTYFRPQEYAGNQVISALSDALRADGADWMQLGADLANSEEWPGLRGILAKDVNALGPEGLLASYVFTRYLIESRPTAIEGVLTSVGAIEPPDQWFARHLQSTPEGLDRRVRRWAAEVVATAPAAAPAPQPPVKAPDKPPIAPPGTPPAPPAKPGDKPPVAPPVAPPAPGK